jgi:hypothetical protein
MGERRYLVNCHRNPSLSKPPDADSHKKEA